MRTIACATMRALDSAMHPPPLPLPPTSLSPSTRQATVSRSRPRRRTAASSRRSPSTSPKTCCSASAGSWRVNLGPPLDGYEQLPSRSGNTPCAPCRPASMTAAKGHSSSTHDMTPPPASVGPRYRPPMRDAASDPAPPQAAARASGPPLPTSSETNAAPASSLHDAPAPARPSSKGPARLMQGLSAASNIQTPHSTPASGSVPGGSAQAPCCALPPSAAMPIRPWP